MSEMSKEIYDGWYDPTAIRIGNFVGADDIPAEGWPDDFKPEVVARILRALDEVFPEN
jgi:hypothetical protein